MKILLTNLYRVANKFNGALTKYAALPVTHISQSTLSSALNTARANRSAHVAAARATRVAASKQKNVRLAAIAFVTSCRDALTPALGRHWSNAWIPAGWKNHTLAVPRTLDDLVQLLEDLHQFLTNDARLEDPDNLFTAEEVQGWLTRLEAAETELSGAKTAQRAAKTAREAAESTLLGQTRGLVSELELILPQSDERWIEFVSEVPSDEQRPEPVEGVVLTGGAPGELDVDWEASPRAERYQVCIKVTGVDTEFRHVLTVRDTNATLTGLTPGADVTVRIVAANVAGEAASSEDETGSIPALAAAA